MRRKIKKKNDGKKPPKKRVKVASISHADKEPTIIARDGQSIKYKNRIAYDKNNSLEWIAGPSFSNVGIFPTKKWISNLNLSGGRWRLPSLKELYTLYRNKDNLTKITSLFKTKNKWVWTSSGYIFNLRFGNWNVINDTDSNPGFGFIVLAVRSLK